MKINLIIIFVLFIFVTASCASISESRIHGVQIIDLKSESKHLLFYGSRHCNDKSDPMFKDIEKYFSTTNPQIVLVEGYMNKNEYENSDMAILDGESAYVSYLAQKQNIPLDTVEPSLEEQYKRLLSKYDKEKVLSMYILRQLYQYQNKQGESPKSIHELLTRFVSGMMQKGFPLSESQTKFEYIRGLLKQYINIEIDESNWTKLDVYSVVYKKGSEINDIYKEVYIARNEFLVSTIEKNLNEYDRIFIIMGSQHVIDEKNEINQIFSKYKK